jgi:hypothetical protein
MIRLEQINYWLTNFWIIGQRINFPKNKASRTATSDLSVSYVFAESVSSYDGRGGGALNRRRRKRRSRGMGSRSGTPTRGTYLPVLTYLNIPSARLTLHSTKLCTKFNIFRKTRFFGTKVSSEASLSIPKNLKVTRLQGFTQNKF